MLKIDMKALISDSIKETGNTLVQGSKANMDKISTGRTYIIGGQAHIASKAGDSPNNFSGSLKSTIRYETTGNILEFGAGNSQINYAKFLEESTVKMKQRPNYNKTVVENEAEIDRIISNNVKKYMGFER